jgi:mono/diheme cytochrome c family protein
MNTLFTSALSPHATARFAVMLCLGFFPAWSMAQDVAVETADASKLERGAAIYRTMCANCHGDKGQGVTEFYAEPLVGDASLGELTKVIQDTMPEGEPEKCVGPDAEAVSLYIFDTFYSQAAQVRNRPARIGLARLTGNQLRQSLADLYAHFGGIIEKPSQERGVQAKYFDGDRFKKENLKIERVDPVLDFDFVRESPGEGINPKSYYVLWEGSLRVERTGRYELIARSTCSFKMDFGRIERMFIDNHVQSGDRTEFRRPVMLTAGRVYPFKIDFIQRTRKTDLPPAKFSLSWVTPEGVEEVIPNRNLVPATGPGVFSLQTILPADDRSYGFERGTAVNREWDESTTASAIEFSKIATAELLPRYLRKHKDKPNEQRALLKAFLKELIEVAFRGQLDESLRKLYIDEQVDATEDDAEAVRRVLLLSLKSPRFLYPLADSDRNVSQRAANRLALVMFDSLPSDEWLLTRIAKNALAEPGQIRDAATKMMLDYRAQAKTRDMFYEWLGIQHLGDVTKDKVRYPGFDAKLLLDLKKSLNASLEDVVGSETSDFRQLFLADWTYTTPALTEFYGESWKPSLATDSKPRRLVVGQWEPVGLQKTISDPNRRFGVLTHPFLMSGFAYHDHTSPIHRGVFLIRYMLGRTLRPPNEAFAPLSPDLHPDLTTRERVSLQTSPESCQVCHSKINALGFVLENYDAVGRYREREGNKAIDSRGQYRSRNDQTVTFQNPADLADYLANSPDAHRAFVNRAFQHFVKQPAEAYGPDTLDRLVNYFVSNGYNIRKLIIEIAVVAASEPTPHHRKQES